MTHQEVLHQFASKLDHLPISIFQSDLNQQFLYVSQTAKKLWGFPYRDLGGRNYDEIKCAAAELADVFQAEDKLVIQRKRPLRIIAFAGYAQNDFQMVFGEKIPFIENGKVGGVIGQFSSVTNHSAFRSAMLLFTNDQKIALVKNSPQFSYIIDDQIEDYSITERQMEVLFYLLRGKTSKEIGKLLHLSQRTIESHIIQLKNTFDCDTKSELIEKAIMLGLVQYLPRGILSNFP